MPPSPQPPSPGREPTSASHLFCLSCHCGCLTSHQIPGQPLTCCLQGPALTSQGPSWGLGVSPSGPCLICFLDAPSPFQVRRGLSATPSLRAWHPHLSPEPGGCPCPAMEGGTTQCLPGPSLSTPGPMGVWVGVCGPALHTTREDQARGISLMVPNPTSWGFGLAHQLSLCECSFHHHRLPQLKWWGRAKEMPQWAWPRVALPQNQAAGTGF